MTFVDTENGRLFFRGRRVSTLIAWWRALNVFQSKWPKELLPAEEPGVRGGRRDYLMDAIAQELGLRVITKRIPLPKEPANG